MKQSGAKNAENVMKRTQNMETRTNSVRYAEGLHTWKQFSMQKE
jgi:hypothetical protein